MAAAAQGLGPNEFKAIAGKLADAEAMVALKDLANRLGSGNTWHEGGFPTMSADVRSTYVANTTVAGLEAADVILLIGTNPRLESPVYNARIRKSWLDGAQVGLVGEAVDLTYKYTHLGSDGDAVAKLAAGASPFFETLKAAQRPVVVVGPGVLNRCGRHAYLPGPSPPHPTRYLFRPSCCSSLLRPVRCAALHPCGPDSYCPSSTADMSTLPPPPHHHHLASAGLIVRHC